MAKVGQFGSLVSSMRQNADEGQLRCTVLEQQMPDSMIPEVRARLLGRSWGPRPSYGPVKARLRTSCTAQVNSACRREGDGKAISVIQKYKDLQRCSLHFLTKN